MIVGLVPKWLQEYEKEREGMTRQEAICEGMKDILIEELIVYGSTHEHAPPHRDCLEDCHTEDQGDGPLKLMRSGGDKHKKCMECWGEYIDKLIAKILRS